MDVKEIYLINRPDRKERLSDARAELMEHYLNAHLFEAIIDTPGWKGCASSHLALLERCSHDGIIMILEDDVEFLVDDVGWWMDTCMQDLPLDWDCFMLGGSPREPQEKYSEFLYRARNVVCAHAIVWNNRQKGAIEYILSHKSDIKKIDRCYSDVIQPKFNCFLARPILATQRQYPSDTCKRSDVSTIIKNYNLYCK